MHKPQEVQVRSLGQKDLLEEGMVAPSSILTWRLPMDREARWVTDHRVTKSRTQLKRFSLHARVLIGENPLGIWERVKRGAKNVFTALWLENGAEISLASLPLIQGRSSMSFHTIVSFWGPHGHIGKFMYARPTTLPTLWCLYRILQ